MNHSGSDEQFEEEEGAALAPSLSSQDHSQAQDAFPTQEVIAWKDRAVVASFLQGLSVDTLVDLLLQTADHDSEWRRRLSYRQKLDHAHLLNDKKKWVASLVGKPTKLDKKRTRIYVQRMQLLLDMLRPLVGAEMWQDISVLCEHALQRLFLVFIRADDSEGYFFTLCQHLLTLHQQAATHMGAPELLGPQVARLLVRAPEGVMNLEPYLPLLGEEGRARFGSSLELLWQAMQLDEVKHSTTVNQTSVRALLMHWYLVEGRIDAWLALKEQEKWLPETYREVAHTLKEAGRVREAIQVLERGIRQYPDAFFIRKMLVDAYLQDGLLEEAQDILWQQFLTSPTYQHYAQLRAIVPEAERALWREKALAHAHKVEQKISVDGKIPYKGVQLAIWLAEENDEQAVALATKYRCDTVTVEALAMRLEKTAQDHAAQLHQQLIAREIEKPTTAYFDDALERLIHLHSVLEPEVFLALLTRLRLKYAQQRKFLSLLNEKWNPHLEPERYVPPATPTL